jgi:hypothetical protein
MEATSTAVGSFLRAAPWFKDLSEDKKSQIHCLCELRRPALRHELKKGCRLDAGDDSVRDF